MDHLSVLDDIMFDENDLDIYYISHHDYQILSNIFDIQMKKFNKKIKTKRVVTYKIAESFKSILEHLYMDGGIIWTDEGFNLTDSFQASYNKLVEEKKINSSNIKCFEKRASILGYKHRENKFFKR